MPVPSQTQPVVVEHHGLFSGAILFRETARAARQWRTYASRAAFSGVLIGIIIFAVSASATYVGAMGAPDPATYGSMGRSVFLGFAVFQTLIATLVAPLVAARAVIEEREEGTLELIVLTKLSPREILFAKIGSSLLLLITIVLGAMPVMSLVTSLGGVSIVEVVAVTLNSVAAVAVLGTLGAFFALFTRSQVIAAGGAIAFAIPVFLFVPWVYAFVCAHLLAATYLSPFYGPVAEGWAALLPILAFIPLITRTLRIGSNVFAMRIANVGFGRLFSWSVWEHRRWMVEIALLIVSGGTLVPGAMFVSWVHWVKTDDNTIWFSPTTDAAIAFVCYGMLWLWFVYGISAMGWVYLRLCSEWVIAIEAMVSPVPSTLAKGKGRIPPILTNPVLWRETRPRVFGGLAGGFAAWVILMWAALQSMVWLIPGGLTLIGALNVLAGWFLAAGLAVSTIEQERRSGTHELLLSSKLSNHAIVLGKLVGVALPSLPLTAVGAALVALGMPIQAMFTGYFSNTGVDFGQGEMVTLFLRGSMMGLWAVAMWAAVTSYAFALVLRLEKPRTAYGWAFGTLGALIIVPWMLYSVFSWFSPAAFVLRLVFPLVSNHDAWWEPLLTGTVVGVFATALFALVIIQFRAWSAAVLR